MPNGKPIIRAMEWHNVKMQMPNNISKHLPDGDPVENHEEIKREIDTMIAVGPEGKSVIEDYVNGEITESQMEKRLDKILEKNDLKNLEVFRRNLRVIRRETAHPLWKEMIPMMFHGPNQRKMIKAAEDLNKIAEGSNASEDLETEVEKVR